MQRSESCIKQFIDEYSFRLEITTAVKYGTAIKQLLNFCDKPFNDLTTRDIRSWLTHLNEYGYKQGTIKYKIFALRLFYQYCLEEELIAHNPVEAIPLPKVEDKLPHYLTHEQLTQLRALCKGNLLRRAVIEVLYNTGVRVSELTNMKLEHINWTERMIHIPKGKGKKERIVLFTKECEEHLKAYLQSRRDELPFVFLNQWRTDGIASRTINGWFQRYRDKLGIFLSPHTLRHTFAAHLTMKGMSLACIQVLLGHENPRYTHLYARLHSHAQKQMYDEWM
jgi:site-specific recombinase XerD